MDECKNQFWPQAVTAPSQSHMSLVGLAGMPPSLLRASGCLQLLASPSLPSLGCSQSLFRLCQVHQPLERVHVPAFHRGIFWGSFFWRSAVLPGSCMVSTGYRGLTKRLKQTLAWHSFNCPTGQYRVLPANAAAHLAALK